MSEANRINLSVGVPGINAKAKRIKQGITMDQTIKWLKSKGYGENLTNELIKIASKYPVSALNGFRKNLNEHIIRIQGQDTKLKETEGEQE